MGFQMMQDMARMYAEKGKDEAYRISRNILFDIAHLLGKEDARVFHKEMGLTDPISKLAAGPIHFAYSGWARVELKDGSVMTPDENFELYYSHPNSFEADAWIEHGKQSKFPVCAMNSGYSSGWCSESFDLDLTAVELTCRACGDPECSFVMAPTTKIREIVKHLQNQAGDDARKYSIPLFFERKKMEESLEQSIREKEILIKEVHHRVKNNLQIVSSLLNLQSQSSKNKMLQEQFRESQNRIQAMALLHESLYAKGNLAQVNPHTYFASIIFQIRMAFGLSYYPVHIDLEVADNLMHLDPDLAIPCGLILNEAVTNSMKHAFPERQGNIQIRFARQEDKYQLTITDNGVGIDTDRITENTVGMQIIDVLTGQLDGEKYVGKTPNGIGTQIRVTFSGQ
jgi:two-component sensor histidine kinase/predicted hydrocarbon binding protein